MIEKFIPISFRWNRDHGTLMLNVCACPELVVDVLMIVFPAARLS